jgi:hypothetical protein
MTRLGARSEGDHHGVDAALEDLEDAAAVDVQVPVDSPRREVTLTKRILRKLMRWYLGYLAEQTATLGQATLRVAHVLAERADRLDDTTAGLVGELSRLGDRLERLERLVGLADGGSSHLAPGGGGSAGSGSPGAGGDERG